MADKTPQELGKEFEDWISEILKEIQSSTPSVAHRLYDTRSAMSYLPAQPGDHILVCNGMANLIECKLSTVESSMTRAFISSGVSPEQAAFMRVWGRAKAGCHFFFSDFRGGEVEHWDGVHVAMVKHTPRMKPDKSFCTRVVKDKATVKALIIDKMKWGDGQ